MDKRIAGSNIKLVIMATNSVIEISTPIATVPPNPEAAKMAKPQNIIIAVYTILNPVSLIAMLIELATVEFIFFNSCRYFVRK